MKRLLAVALLLFSSCAWADGITSGSVFWVSNDSWGVDINTVAGNIVRGGNGVFPPPLGQPGTASIPFTITVGFPSFSGYPWDVVATLHIPSVPLPGDGLAFDFSIPTTAEIVMTAHPLDGTQYTYVGTGLWSGSAHAGTGFPIAPYIYSLSPTLSFSFDVANPVTIPTPENDGFFLLATGILLVSAAARSSRHRARDLVH
jgi:hypothetical protein